MSAMLLNPVPNRQNVAQNLRLCAFRFADAGFGRNVVDAAPASILAVRKSQHYRTPSLDGRRAGLSATPIVLFRCLAKHVAIARLLAHSGGRARNCLSARFGLSCVDYEYPIERKGKFSCVTNHGLLRRSPVLSLRHVAIRKQNRRFTVPAPVPAQRPFSTATLSPARRLVPRPTLSTARKTQPSVKPLTPRTIALFQTISNPNLTAVRLPTRGGFAYDIPITKRDIQCSQRS